MVLSPGDTFDDILSPALDGGALCITSTPVILDNCRFTNCSGGTGGAVFSSSSATLTIKGSTQFENCSASANGGGLYCSGTGLSLEGSTTFTNCSATGSGGGAYVTGSSPFSINQVNFVECIATQNAGGLWTDSSVTITNTNFTQCSSARSGGGVYASGSPSTLEDVEFTSCKATGASGGGLWIAATLTMNNTKFDSCEAVQDGGGVEVSSGPVSMENVEFLLCTVTRSGGGLHVAGGDVKINGTSNFTNCRAQTDGGGISISAGSLTLTAIPFTTCRASGNGGGIHHRNKLTLTQQLTFVSCTAGNGGAIYSDWSGTTSLDVIITNCNATSNGGGLFINSGTITLPSSSKVTSNATSNGGGVYLRGGTLNSYANMTSCKANFGGAICAVGGNLKIHNGVNISSCDASTNGGGIMINGAVTAEINSTTIQSCSAQSNGGGLHIAECTSVTINSPIESCSATTGGGGLSVTGGGTVTIISTVEFRSCSASVGGGISIVHTSGNFKIPLGTTFASCTGTHGKNVFISANNLTQLLSPPADRFTVDGSPSSTNPNYYFNFMGIDSSQPVDRPLHAYRTTNPRTEIRVDETHSKSLDFDQCGLDWIPCKTVNFGIWNPQNSYNVVVYGQGSMESFNADSPDPSTISGSPTTSVLTSIDAGVTVETNLIIKRISLNHQTSSYLTFTLSQPGSNLTVSEVKILPSTPTAGLFVVQNGLLDITDLTTDYPNQIISQSGGRISVVNSNLKSSFSSPFVHTGGEATFRGSTLTISANGVLLRTDGPHELTIESCHLFGWGSGESQGIVGDPTKLRVDLSDFTSFKTTVSNGSCVSCTAKASSIITFSASTTSLCSAMNGGSVYIIAKDGSDVSIGGTFSSKADELGGGVFIWAESSTATPYKYDLRSCLFPSCSAVQNGSKIFVRANNLSNALHRDNFPSLDSTMDYACADSSFPTEHYPIKPFFDRLASPVYLNVTGSSYAWCGFSTLPCTTLQLAHNRPDMTNLFTIKVMENIVSAQTILNKAVIITQNDSSSKLSIQIQGGLTFSASSFEINTLQVETSQDQSIVVQSPANLKLVTVSLTCVAAATGSVFKIASSDSNGGAIQAESLQNSDEFSLDHVTFTNCQATTANSRGGAVYLSGATTKLTFTNLVFSQCHADYGENVYIQADTNLKEMVTNSTQVDAKFIDSYSNDTNKMNLLMGSNGNGPYIPFVLYFQQRTSPVYAGNTDDLTVPPRIISADVDICGFGTFPCSTIKYAVTVSNTLNLVTPNVVELLCPFTHGIAANLDPTRPTIISHNWSPVLKIKPPPQSFTSTGDLTFDSFTFDLSDSPSGHTFQATSGLLTLNSTTLITSTVHTESFLRVSGAEVTLNGFTVSSVTWVKSLFQVLSGELFINHASMENVVGSSRGLIDSKSTLQITNSTFTSGTKRFLFIDVNSQTTIVNTTISQFTSLSDNGAGIFGTKMNLLKLDNTTMDQCKGLNGGAIYVAMISSSSMELVGGTKFTGCTATGKGGGVYVNTIDGSLQLTGTQFSSCWASSSLDGHDLFIDSNNLTKSVLSSSHPSNPRFDFSFKNTSAEFDYMEGYDTNNVSCTIPLCLFYWTLNETAFVFDDGTSNGFDAVVCGFVEWPCHQFQRALLRAKQCGGSEQVITVDTICAVHNEQVLDGSATTVNGSSLYGTKSIVAIKTTDPVAIRHVGNTTMERLDFQYTTASSGSEHCLIHNSGRLKFILTSFTSLSSNPTRSILISISGFVDIEEVTLTQQDLEVEGFIMRGNTQTTIFDSNLNEISTKTTNGFFSSNGPSHSMLLHQCRVSNSKSNSSVFAGTNFASYVLRNVTFSNLTVTNGNGSALNLVILSSRTAYIEDCLFTLCDALEGNGGGIYLNMHPHGIFKINATLNTTFTSCQATSTGSNGLGGAMSIYLQDSATDFLFSNLSIQTCEARSGKQIFIEGDNLTKSIVESKFDFPYSTQIDDMRGYDFRDTNVAIPLIYYFSNMFAPAIVDSVNGADFARCGSTSYPCQSLDYAIQLLRDHSLAIEISIRGKIETSNNLECNETMMAITVDGVVGTTAEWEFLVDAQLVNSGNTKIEYVIFKTSSATSTETELILCKEGSIELKKCKLEKMTLPRNYSLMRVTKGEAVLEEFGIDEGSTWDDTKGIVVSGTGKVIVRDSQMKNVNCGTSGLFEVESGGSLKLLNVSISDIDGMDGVVKGTNGTLVQFEDVRMSNIGLTSGKSGVNMEVGGSSSFVMTNVSFVGCKSSSNGGAVFVTLWNGGEFVVNGSGMNTFTSCSAKYDGGGIFMKLEANARKYKFSNMTFMSCSAVNGKGHHICVETDDLFSSIKESLFDFSYSTVLADMQGTEDGSVYVPLVILFRPRTSPGYVSANGADSSICGFEDYTCKTISCCARVLENANVAVVVAVSENIELSASEQLNFASQLTIHNHNATYSGLKFKDHGSTILENVGRVLFSNQIFDGTERTAASSGLVLVESTAGNLSILTSQLKGLVSADAKKFIRVTGGVFEIVDCVVQEVDVDEGYLIEMDGGKMKMENMTVKSSLVKGKNGLIQITGLTLESSVNGSTFLNLDMDGSCIVATDGKKIEISNTTFSNVTSGKEGGGLKVGVGSTGRLGVTDVKFRACKGTNGGGISVSIVSGSKFEVSGSSEFVSCEANGGAPNGLGGGIYVKAVGGGSIQLTNPTFTGCVAFEHGHDIFVDSSDLEDTVTSTVGAIDSKFGFNYRNTSSETEYMMGYDGLNPGQAIPIIYYFVPVGSPVVVSWTSGIDFGRCGSASYPCKSIEKGLDVLKQNSLTMRVEVRTDLNSAASLELKEMDLEIGVEGGGGTTVEWMFEVDTQLVNSGHTKIESVYFKTLSAASTETELILCKEGSIELKKCKLEKMAGPRSYSLMRVTKGEAVLEEFGIDEDSKWTGNGGIVVSGTGKVIVRDSQMKKVSCGTSGLFEVESGGSLKLLNVSISDIDGMDGVVKGTNGTLVQFEDVRMSNIGLTSGTSGVNMEVGGSSSFVMTNVSFVGCKSSGNGGAVYVKLWNGGEFVVNGSGMNTFTSCSADDDGGGIFMKLEANARKYKFSNMTFMSCSAVNGKGHHICVETDDLFSSIKESLFDFSYSTVLADMQGTEDGSVYVPLVILFRPRTSPGYVSANGADSSICGFEDYTCKTISCCARVLENANVAVVVAVSENIELSASEQLNFASQLTIHNHNATYSGLKFKDHGSTILENVGRVLFSNQIFDGTERTAASSGLVLVESTAGNLSILTSQLKGLVSADAKKFIRVTGGVFEIVDCVVQEVDVDEGYLIEMDGGKMKMENMTVKSSLVKGKNGLIQITGLTLESSVNGSTFLNLDMDGSCIVATDGKKIEISNTTFSNVTSGKEGGGLKVGVGSTGRLGVTDVKFRACKGTNGGGISVSIVSGSKFEVSGSSEFVSCEANGGAPNGLGGGIYVKAVGGGSIQLTNPTFTGCVAFEHGHDIFVDSSDLEDTVTSTVGAIDSKFGFNYRNTSSETEYMMGYDGLNPGQAIPIIYYFVPVGSPVVVSWTSGIDFGRCGSASYPCKSIEKGLDVLKQNSLTMRVEVRTDLNSAASLELKEMDLEIGVEGGGGTTVEWMFEVDTQLVNSGHTKIESVYFKTLSAASTETELILCKEGSIELKKCKLEKMAGPRSYSLMRVTKGEAVLEEFGIDEDSKWTGNGGIVVSGTGKVIVRDSQMKKVSCGTSGLFEVESGGSLKLLNVSISDIDGMDGVVKGTNGTLVQFEDVRMSNIGLTSGTSGVNMEVGGSSSFVMTNVSFVGCKSSSNGGAVFVTLWNGGEFVVNGSGMNTFTSCSADDDGGGIFMKLEANARKYKFSNMTFMSCSAVNGKGHHICVETDDLFSSIKESLFDFSYSTVLADMQGTEDGSVYVPLVILFRPRTSPGYVSANGADSSICGFEDYTCKTISCCARVLENANVAVVVAVSENIELSASEQLNFASQLTIHNHNATYSGLKFKDHGSTILENVGRVLFSNQIFDGTERTAASSGLVLVESTAGNLSILTSQLKGLVSADAKKFIRVTGGVFEIVDCVVQEVDVDEGYLIEMDGGKMKMENMTVKSSLVKGKNGLIQITGLTLESSVNGSTFLNLDMDGSCIVATDGKKIEISNTTFSNVTSGKEGGGLKVGVGSTGRLGVTDVKFRACKGTNGGGISVSIVSGSKFEVSGSSEFVSCEANGGAPNGLGGGIYVKAVGGGSIQLTNPTFTGCVAFEHGHDIFVDSSDLEDTVTSTVGAIDSKFGFNYRNTSSETEYMMGYDGLNPGQAIPIIYYFVPVGSPVVVSWTSGIDFGRCGSASYPCKSIEKGLDVLKQNSLTMRVEVRTDLNSAASLELKEMDLEIGVEGGGGTTVEWMFEVDTQLVNSGHTKIESVYFKTLSAASTETELILCKEGSIELKKCKLEKMAGPRSYSLMRVTKGEAVLEEFGIDEDSKWTGNGGIVVSGTGKVIVRDSQMKKVSCGTSGLFEVESGGSLKLLNVSISDIDGMDGVVKGTNGTLVQFEDVRMSNIGLTSGTSGVNMEVGGSSSFVMTNVSFVGCKSSGNGGAVYVKLWNGGEFVVNGSGMNTFTSCSADDDGGGIFMKLEANARKYKFSNMTFMSCSAVNGKGHHICVETDDLFSSIKESLFDFSYSTVLADMQGTEDGSVYVPLVILFRPRTSPGYVSANGADSSICGFEDYTCKTISCCARVLENANVAVVVAVSENIELSASEQLNFASQLTIHNHNATYSGLKFKDHGSTILENVGRVLFSNQIFDGTERTAASSGLVLVESTAGNLSILTSQLKGLVSADAKKFIRVTGGVFEIVDCVVQEVDVDEGYLIEMDGGKMKMENMTVKSSLVKGKNGLIQITGLTLESSVNGSTFLNLDMDGSCIVATDGKKIEISNTTFSNVTSGKEGGGLKVGVGSTGRLGVTDVKFRACKGTNGGGISVSIVSGSKFEVSGSSEFVSCEANGGAPNGLGGGIYVKAVGGGSIQLTNPTFTGCVAFEHGHDIFISSDNLNETVASRTSPIDSKFAFSYHNASDLFDYMQGYDQHSSSQLVPLCLFFWTSQSPAYLNSTGSDVVRCGFSEFPCLTLEYSSDLLQYYALPVVMHVQTLCLLDSYYRIETPTTITSAISHSPGQLDFATFMHIFSPTHITQLSLNPPLSGSAFYVLAHSLTISECSLVPVVLTGRLVDTMNGTTSFDSSIIQSITFDETVAACQNGSFVATSIQVKSSSVNQPIFSSSRQKTRITLDNCLFTALSTSTSLISVVQGSCTIASTTFHQINPISSSSFDGSCIHINTLGTSICTITNVQFNFTSTESGNGGSVYACLAGSSSLILNGNNGVSFNFTEAGPLTSTVPSTLPHVGFGGGLCIWVLDTTASFGLHNLTFSNCDASFGKNLFVASPNLTSHVTSTSFDFSFASDYPPMLGFDQLNDTFTIPLALFFTPLTTPGYVSDSAYDSVVCGFFDFPCYQLATLVSRMKKESLTLDCQIITSTTVKDTVVHTTGMFNISSSDPISYAIMTIDTITSSSTTVIKSSGSLSFKVKPLSTFQSLLLKQSGSTANLLNFSLNEPSSSDVTFFNLFSFNDTKTTFSLHSIHHLINILQTPLISLNNSLTIIQHSNFSNVASNSPFISINSDRNVSISNSTFSVITTSGCDGSAVGASIGSWAVLLITNCTFYSCISDQNGGALSIIITTTMATSTVQKSLFSICSCNYVSGRGGAIILRGTAVSTEFSFKTLSFQSNVGFVGRDIFVECEDILTVCTAPRFAFSIESPYDQTNAVYGTDRQIFAGVDFDLLSLLFTQSSPTVFVSSTAGSDSHLGCGLDRLQPCQSIHLAAFKLSGTSKVLYVDSASSGFLSRQLVTDSLSILPCDLSDPVAPPPTSTLTSLIVVSDVAKSSNAIGLIVHTGVLTIKRIAFSLPSTINTFPSLILTCVSNSTTAPLPELDLESVTYTNSSSAGIQYGLHRIQGGVVTCKKITVDVRTASKATFTVNTNDLNPQPTHLHIEDCIVRGLTSTADSAAFLSARLFKPSPSLSFLSSSTITIVNSLFEGVSSVGGSAVAGILSALSFSPSSSVQLVSLNHHPSRSSNAIVAPSIVMDACTFTNCTGGNGIGTAIASITSCNVTLHQSAFKGTVPPSSLLNQNILDELQNWYNVLFNLVDVNLTSIHSNFTHNGGGGIQATSSNITLTEALFEANKPMITGYETLRRNIRCTNTSVYVTSLSGGDGTPGSETEYLWIEADDTSSLGGILAESKQTSFVPSLTTITLGEIAPTAREYSFIFSGQNLFPINISAEIILVNETSQNETVVKMLISTYHNETAFTIRVPMESIPVSLTPPSNTSSSLSNSNSYSLYGLVRNGKHTTDRIKILAETKEPTIEDPEDPNKKSSSWIVVTLIVVVVVSVVVIVIVVIVCVVRHRKERMPYVTKPRDDDSDSNSMDLPPNQPLVKPVNKPNPSIFVSSYASTDDDDDDDADDDDRFNGQYEDSTPLRNSNPPQQKSTGTTRRPFAPSSLAQRSTSSQRGETSHRPGTGESGSSVYTNWGRPNQDSSQPSYPQTFTVNPQAQVTSNFLRRAYE
ncbi:hypothetical protein BLNAU_15988 [Blattamonas nauphoetae]|uniref:Adhesin-like protein n=1 Tax=Blattamonas nauphoetae TaxID=2049346 RepID=A0ABQ9XCT0_9EUKA|nr:hypothetical protein BLNAU_15988 [Blattamonas nauphoetae]